MGEQEKKKTRNRKRPPELIAEEASFNAELGGNLANARRKKNCS